MATRLVAGCMSGTSLDGIDAALVAVVGTGLTMTATVRRVVSRPLGRLAAPLRELAAQRPMTAGDIAALAREFGLLHLDLLRELIGNERIDLVAVHGQTVFHAPPVSWQLIDAAPLARGLGVPVVFDLRAADLAAGGHGAPITPLADYVLFRDEGETRAVLNLGGYCNYTWLPAALPSRAGEVDPSRPSAASAAIRGGDICACNHVLDAAARALFGVPFDDQGRRALAGTVRFEPRDALVAMLRAQSTAGRSLGTGDELHGWIEQNRGRFRPADLVRSVCDAIAMVVLERVGAADRLILAGGGAKNLALCNALAQHGANPISLSDEFGVPTQGREAAAIAVLGALCADGAPITLPQITGCTDPPPRAGTWIYP